MLESLSDRGYGFTESEIRGTYNIKEQHNLKRKK